MSSRDLVADVCSIVEEYLATKPLGTPQTDYTVGPTVVTTQNGPTLVMLVGLTQPSPIVGRYLSHVDVIGLDRPLDADRVKSGLGKALDALAQMQNNARMAPFSPPSPS